MTNVVYQTPNDFVRRTSKKIYRSSYNINAKDQLEMQMGQKLVQIGENQFRVVDNKNDDSNFLGSQVTMGDFEK